MAHGASGTNVRTSADQSTSCNAENHSGHDEIGMRIDRLCKHADELHKQLQEAQSDVERARRRAAADAAIAYQFGATELATLLLPFKDALEAALAINTTDAQALKAGLELAAKQLDGALEKFGFEELGPQPGDPYDHQKHDLQPAQYTQATLPMVEHVEKKGYSINGRIIRNPVVKLVRGS